MSPLTSPFWIQAAVVACVLAASGLFLVAERRIAGQFGFSLDDSWIYATFARNIATGHGYAFNAGERITGATGPLYALVLAGLYAIFWDVILPAKLLGVACLCGSGLLVYRSLRHLVPQSYAVPALGAILVALSPSLVWAALSGMEIPLFVLLTCTGLFFYTRRQWTRAALFWALGVWVRPDGILLALLGMCLRPWLGRAALVPLLLPALVLAAFFAFNLAAGGTLFPNSVLVKSHFGWDVPARLAGMAREWSGLWGLPWPGGEFPPHAMLLLPLIVLGAAVTAWRLPALAAYVVGLPLALAVFGASSGAHARYIMPTVPFGIVLAAVGIDWLMRRTRRGMRTALVGVTGVCLVWQIVALERMGTVHGWNVENINHMQRLLAESLRQATAPGDTIAVNDVGAMGYFSGCYIVDLVGLVSPKHTLPENLSRFRPKYLAIFPNWYRRYLVSDYSVQRTFIYAADSSVRYGAVIGAGLRRNTICARDQMIVFARLAPGDIGPERMTVTWH